MDQNVIVPTVFGERTCRTKIKNAKYLWTNNVWTKYCMDKKKVKGQSIFGLTLCRQNIAWTKSKGTKYLWAENKRKHRLKVFGQNVFGPNLFGLSIYGPKIVGEIFLDQIMHRQNSYGLKIVGQKVFGQNNIGQNVIGWNMFGRIVLHPFHLMMTSLRTVASTVNIIILI